MLLADPENAANIIIPPGSKIATQVDPPVHKIAGTPT
jgi:hypothetical protein